MNSETLDIAVSGRYWVGEKGSIFTSVRNVSTLAKKEAQFSIYSFGSNITEFADLLKVLLECNIKVQIIVNKFNNQPAGAKNILLKLKSLHDNLTILDFNPSSRFEDLHAKIIVVDRNWALIGSSNVSWHGYVSNHEVAVIIRGEIAEQIAGLLDRLARSSDTSLVKL